MRKRMRTSIRTAVAICLYGITEQVRSCNLKRKTQRDVSSNEKYFIKVRIFGKLCKSHQAVS